MVALIYPAGNITLLEYMKFFLQHPSNNISIEIQNDNKTAFYFGKICRLNNIIRKPHLLILLLRPLHLEASIHRGSSEGA